MRPDVLRLRAELLAAMAAIGCGGGQPHPHRHHHHHHPRRGDDTAKHAAPPVPSPAAPQPEECGLVPDTLFESECAPAGAGECPAQAVDLIGVDLDASATALYVTPSYRSGAFLFDARLTDRYRMAHDGTGCCFARCTPIEVAASGGEPAVGNGRYKSEIVYIPMPAGGTRFPAAGEPRCPAVVSFGGSGRAFVRAHDGTCGYSVLVRDPSILGRAAREDGVARLPEVAHTDDDLANRWIDRARAEHASIAAFGNLSLQLLSLGAPPALLEATHAAALDEIRHARDAFAIASRFAGRTIEAGAFPAAARLSPHATLESLAIETFVDGCIAESRAALDAGREARTTADREIAAVLARVAEDETRHAALAWSIVGWCLACEPAIAERLRGCLAECRDDDEILAISRELLDRAA